MLVGLLTVPIAKMYSIESSSIKRILSIIYWFVFSWALYVIGFIVTYFVFGDDEATLIDLKPAIAVASLVVASIHTGLFLEILNKEEVSN
ncbi:hypothetical protein L8Q46_02415 [Enterobacter roggenkampii]|uniref:hypothetical protein n=1 Tax=Enterobacter roggenkampii TaxID=1812935 RepID=UPI0020053E0C|nr:hypothetical protein [Enterobacter roggenkampii]MCK7051524.1 hypothetical protein [Enterobacter roggenkampii]HDT2078991.1 hypothetical protein [Enterobacter roggenkampii]